MQIPAKVSTRFGPIREADADGQPGHYYVTVRRETGEYALALGPFTADRHGSRAAHMRALGYVNVVRRYVNDHGSAREQMGLSFGTSRLPLTAHPKPGRLNPVIFV
jgi:hypothetical protein